MDIKFSNIFKEIIENSKKEAQSHNNNVIGPEHLLLSLLSIPECKAVAMIKQSVNGASIEELRSALDNELLTRSDAVDVDKNIAIGDLANRIIKLSALEARMLKKTIVDTEHLLLALFHNKEVQNMSLYGQFF